MMDLQTVSQIIGGQHQGMNAVFNGLVNDTRKDCSKKLYVAIKGPQFDGHDFIDTAMQHGASAVVVEDELPQDSEIPSVRTNDSIASMGLIAANWRKKVDIPVLAITGSAGKTTLKEMAGSIMSVSHRGVVTEGNLNNHIGVPLMLTRLAKSDEFAIVEMGMNHAGEIRYLTNMASPTIAIINNAAPAHLDELGSIEAVAKAKGEIIEGLADDGLQILNADDQFCALWQGLAEGKRQVTFGLSSEADITASYQTNAEGSVLQVRGIYGKFEVKLNVPGEHHVRNALAVIAATIEMGASISDVQQGLCNYQPIVNRGGIHRFKSMLLVDDTYNANPASMQAAFDALALLAKDLKQEHADTHISVALGSMAELGQQTEILHQEVGKSAKQLVHKLYCIGAYKQHYQKGFGKHAFSFENHQSLSEAIIRNIDSNDGFHLILVKGSRSAGMEKIVSVLLENQNNKTANVIGD